MADISQQTQLKSESHIKAEQGSAHMNIKIKQQVCFKPVYI